jgi:hypothetical protein
MGIPGKLAGGATPVGCISAIGPTELGEPLPLNKKPPLEGVTGGGQV